MMEGKVMKRNVFFAQALKAAGIDLTKDFFCLSSSEVSKVDEIRRAFRYSGKNSVGRSPARQFYYSAQAAE